jgi:succinyl-diaminopimelate desuccinylase
MEPQKLCSELVAIQSENPPGDTIGVIEYIREFLENLGVTTAVTQNPGGKCNLITTKTPNRLLFLGHVDVVPACNAGWTYPPCSGLIKDGYVWGRGSTDMKGGCASILCAAESLIENNIDLPATLAFVCDEETGGECGIRYLLSKKMLKPGDCLIAEPTPALHPCVGQKGLCRLEMEFTGTPGHGSVYPVVGVNAIMEALALIGYVKSLHDLTFARDENLKGIIRDSGDVFSEEFGMNRGEEILERITFNPGVISGGEKVNIIAQHCDLSLELRIPWGCNIPDLVQGIADHAPQGKIIKKIENAPSFTDPSCRFVATVCREVGEVMEGFATPILQWAASDARHLRLAGFRVIEYGPGELDTLHGVNERVSISSLEKAARIYQQVMQAYRNP